MTTITLTISDIIGHDLQADGSVYVQCAYQGFTGPARQLTVRVSSNSVSVFAAGDGLEPAESVLVSTTLIDATRRLFGLVGVA